MGAFLSVLPLEQTDEYKKALAKNIRYFKRISDITTNVNKTAIDKYDELNRNSGLFSEHVEGIKDLLETDSVPVRFKQPLELKNSTELKDLSEHLQHYIKIYSDKTKESERKAKQHEQKRIETLIEKRVREAALERRDSRPENNATFFNSPPGNKASLLGFSDIEDGDDKQALANETDYEETDIETDYEESDYPDTDLDDSVTYS